MEGRHSSCSVEGKRVVSMSEAFCAHIFRHKIIEPDKLMPTRSGRLVRGYLLMEKLNMYPVAADLAVALLHSRTVNLLGNFSTCTLAPVPDGATWFTSRIAARLQLPMIPLRKSKIKESWSQIIDWLEPETHFILLEDVISEGVSTEEVALPLQKHGHIIDGIVALVDRQIGGVERLRQTFGCPVEVSLTLDQVLQYGVISQNLTVEKFDEIQQSRAEQRANNLSISTVV